MTTAQLEARRSRLPMPRKARTFSKRKFNAIWDALVASRTLDAPAMATACGVRSVTTLYSWKSPNGSIPNIDQFERLAAFLDVHPDALLE